MRSKYIVLLVVNLTKNGFGDVDFIYDVKILAIRCCFSPIFVDFTAHVQFRPYYYFRFII